MRRDGWQKTPGSTRYTPRYRFFFLHPIKGHLHFCSTFFSATEFPQWPYVVAHFHYVAIGAALTIMEAFHFWISISKSTRNNVAFFIYRIVAEIKPLKIYSPSPLRQYEPPHVCSQILRGGPFLPFFCRTLFRNKSGTTDLDTVSDTEEYLSSKDV